MRKLVEVEKDLWSRFDHSKCPPDGPCGHDDLIRELIQVAKGDPSWGTYQPLKNNHQMLHTNAICSICKSKVEFQFTEYKYYRSAATRCLLDHWKQNHPRRYNRHRT